MWGTSLLPTFHSPQLSHPHTAKAARKWNVAARRNWNRVAESITLSLDLLCSPWKSMVTGRLALTTLNGKIIYVELVCFPNCKLLEHSYVAFTFTWLACSTGHSCHKCQFRLVSEKINEGVLAHTSYYS